MFLLGAAWSRLSDRELRLTALGFQQTPLDYGIGDAALVVNGYHALFEFKRGRADFRTETDGRKGHRQRLLAQLSDGSDAAAEARTTATRAHLAGYGEGDGEERRLVYAPYLTVVPAPTAANQPEVPVEPWSVAALARGLLRLDVGAAYARARVEGTAGRLTMAETTALSRVPDLGADHTTFVRYLRFVLQACAASGDAQDEAPAGGSTASPAARAERALSELSGFWVVVEPDGGRVGYAAFKGLDDLGRLVEGVERQITDALNTDSPSVDPLIPTGGAASRRMNEPAPAPRAEPAPEPTPHTPPVSPADAPNAPGAPRPPKSGGVGPS